MSTHVTGSTSSTHLHTAEIADLLARLAVLMSNQRSNPEIHESQPTPTRVLLTIEEAAEKLGIGRTLMCKLIRTGKIESVLNRSVTSGPRRCSEQLRRAPSHRTASRVEGT